MRIRPVTYEDAELLLAWRNDPDTRAASRNSHPVTPAEHEAWITRSLQQSDTMLLVAEDDDGSALGHVRFVPTDAGYEVSIVLAPEQRGQGKGRAVLEAAQHAFHTAHPNEPLRAFVRSENVASHRMFRAAGYVLIDSDEVGSWYEGGRHA